MGRKWNAWKSMEQDTSGYISRIKETVLLTEVKTYVVTFIFNYSLHVDNIHIIMMYGTWVNWLDMFQSTLFPLDNSCLKNRGKV